MSTVNRLSYFRHNKDTGEWRSRTETSNYECDCSSSLDQPFCFSDNESSYQEDSCEEGSQGYKIACAVLSNNNYCSQNNHL